MIIFRINIKLKDKTKPNQTKNLCSTSGTSFHLSEPIIST